LEVVVTLKSIQGGGEPPMLPPLRNPREAIHDLINEIVSQILDPKMTKDQRSMLLWEFALDVQGAALRKFESIIESLTHQIEDAVGEHDFNSKIILMEDGFDPDHDNGTYSALDKLRENPKYGQGEDL
jgi:hypothetical protein